MTLTWTRPSAPGAPTFAQWNGMTFALVRAMNGGLWRAALFPDGHSHHSRDAYVGSEARAREFIERWASYHSATIARPTRRQVMPHEGVASRKPKGCQDRS